MKAILIFLLFLLAACAPGGTQKCAKAGCDAPASPGSSYCINHQPSYER